MPEKWEMKESIRRLLEEKGEEKRYDEHKKKA
ncbi:hypothetical protein SAMN00808754_0269 [Thermanaeromonas toyohensis ToBE]|uniref:Uncharacterized protein n=1 Tax=Thermanaeromonas toyohensis ToBE TaxID=698762 RepID=A0A1W1VA70_9FIRM|nr:hypothetical protein SAMN00808754_0269 [Thermanaeromonas toyohensis ToBE]